MLYGCGFKIQNEIRYWQIGRLSTCCIYKYIEVTETYDRKKKKKTQMWGKASEFLDLVYYRMQRQLSCEECHIPKTTSRACPSGRAGYLSTSLGTNPEF